MVVTQTNADLRDEKTSKWYILMPNSNFFMIWQIMIAVLLVYFATYVPFEISFLDPPQTTWRAVIDYSIDFLFFIDIFLNFFTAFENSSNNVLEKRLGPIAVNYLTGWFLIDLTATFPT
jgi:hypothetical protein